jgi:DNA-binding MarR family transcriptional regulator
MIEIIRGSLEEQIIKVLQKNYPITTFELASKLRVSQKIVERILQKFQVKGITKLDILPDKIYVRLLRNDFRIVGLKQQVKPIKKKSIRSKNEEYGDDDSIMYS